MKLTSRFLVRFASIVMASEALAADLGATNAALALQLDARVVLKSAESRSTVRASSYYTFAIQGNIAYPVSTPPAPQRWPTNWWPPKEIPLLIYQGTDADESGRDAIARLGSFFGLVARTNDVSPYRSPMTIWKTNFVRLRQFGSTELGSIWLFQDDLGRALAIDTGAQGRGSRSKQVLEQFRAANRSQPPGSETNRTSAAAGSDR